MSASSSRYPEWAHEHNANGALILNVYGRPIVAAEHFMEPHVATVPAAAGVPPWCTCGWTRHRVDGMWVEMVDHLRDMDPERSDTEMKQV